MIIRDYRQSEAHELSRLALAAYAQFQQHYSDWPAMAASLARMPEIDGEIIVAEAERRIIGAVAYIPGSSPKPDYFDRDWPAIRMLAVSVDSRGQGVGRALTEECLARARRDGASVIALHTSPIMSAALSLYRRMGFEWHRDVPPIKGVPYAIYLSRLNSAWQDQP